MKCTCDECGTDMTKLLPVRAVSSEAVKRGTAICEQCGDGEAEFRGWHIVEPKETAGIPTYWVPDVLQ